MFYIPQHCVLGAVPDTSRSIRSCVVTTTLSLHKLVEPPEEKNVESENGSHSFRI